nr:ribosomal protein L29 {N-terminal} [Burkholderia pickettii, Peptide Partial, 17 aa] [Ralstonia pickettii]
MKASELRDKDVAGLQEL